MELPEPVVVAVVVPVVITFLARTPVVVEAAELEYLAQAVVALVELNLDVAAVVVEVVGFLEQIEPCQEAVKVDCLVAVVVALHTVPVVAVVVVAVAWHILIIMSFLQVLHTQLRLEQEEPYPMACSDPDRAVVEQCVSYGLG
jgi:hypothetical protein